MPFPSPSLSTLSHLSDSSILYASPTSSLLSLIGFDGLLILSRRLLVLSELLLLALRADVLSTRPVTPVTSLVLLPPAAGPVIRDARGDFLPPDGRRAGRPPATPPWSLASQSLPSEPPWSDLAERDRATATGLPLLDVDALLFLFCGLGLLLSRLRERRSAPTAAAATSPDSRRGIRPRTRSLSSASRSSVDWDRGTCRPPRRRRGSRPTAPRRPGRRSRPSPRP